MEAVVLPGGGARGAYQVGALQSLINRGGIDPKVISGISVGALNAAILAEGDIQPSLDKLVDIWEGIQGDGDIYKPKFPGWPSPEVNLGFHKSIYHLKPLKRLLRNQLDVEGIRASGKELRIGAVNLQSGDLVTATQESPHLFRWVLASASIPGIFPPVEIMHKLYVDGGLSDISPMASTFKALRDLNAEQAKVYVILTQPLQMPHVKQSELTSGPGIVGRTVELMTSEILRGDIETAQLTNRLIQSGEMDGVKAEIEIIAPDRPPMDTLDFSPKSIRNAIQMGMSDA